MKTKLKKVVKTPLKNPAYRAEADISYKVDGKWYIGYDDRTILIPAKIITHDDKTKSIEKLETDKLPIVCFCGCDDFKVYYSDSYETSAECKNCGKFSVVHSG